VESDGREVLRVAELKVALVEYTDADNQNPRTRLVVVLPATPTHSEKAYFLNDNMLGKPASAWFTSKLVSKLKESGR
jgi:hypothetical protein